MSDDKLTTNEDVLIGRNHWDVPVSVELRAYLHFGRRMDSQLRRLVTRWVYAASPKSRGLVEEPHEAHPRRR